MKHTLTAGAALLLSTGLAHAGGLDRSGQSIAPLFEDGTYAELSFSTVMPSVSGELRAAPLDSGNVAEDYFQFGLAFKDDINERLSYAIILEQPFGANVNYDDNDAGYPLEGSDAEFRSQSVTALGRYKFSDKLSVHGGVRVISIDADAVVNVAGAFGYEASYDRDTQAAFVVGAAYEVPDIALRVALTYTSETEFSHDTQFAVGAPPPGPLGPEQEGETEYTLPQSVNLEFQSGIAADTLLFGSLRWVEWSAGDIDSPGYPLNPLVSFEDDTLTYNIGIGRRFTDTFSGFVSVGYERETDGEASNLAPTDGNLSVGLGGSYALANGVELSGGVSYVSIGDAETNVADFEDNSAIGVGFQVAYNY
ncbi:OmpP1/FadL family transporter [Yoonia sp. 2307UL14-13]|uniref:OmpP1/FadL family transporter n=1 Tax=Yoonia sp. 2307UL14-13 TaxID=3126506 RepID=UPI0030AF5FBB